MAAVIAGHGRLDETFGLAGGPDELETCERDVCGRCGGRGHRWRRDSRGSRHGRSYLRRAHVPGDRLPHEQPNLLFVHR